MLRNLQSSTPLSDSARNCRIFLIPNRLFLFFVRQFFFFAKAFESLARICSNLSCFKPCSEILSVRPNPFCSPFRNYLMLVFFFSFFSCLFLLRIFLFRFRSTFLDVPNSRSSHQFSTPRGGGVSFALITFIVLLYSLFIREVDLPIFILLALPLALVGLLDDYCSLSSSFRFSVQFFTALFVVIFSPFWLEFLLPRLSGPFAAFFIFLFLTIVFISIINFTNFMDGLDGLVIGCMTIVFSTLGFIFGFSLPLLALLGGMIAFLIFNWAPAKIFMGDVGSTFLGCLFASYVFQSSDLYQSLSVLLLASHSLVTPLSV